MKWLINLLIGVVLLIAMGIGAAAHAREMICLPDIEATATLHADGDADQSGDSESGVPHHHGGCHGHHVAAPVAAAAAVALVASSDRVPGWGSTMAALAMPGTALRPPIA